MIGWLAWRRLRRHRVQVNLKSGGSYEGILLRKSGPLIFVTGPSLLVFEHGHENGQDVGGTVVVERSNVSSYLITD